MPDTVRGSGLEEEYRVTLTVQGDDAAPRFEHGDRLVCAPQGSAAIGDDIVVVVREGNIRVGRLSALDALTVIIDQAKAELSIERRDVGAIWPIRRLEKDAARSAAD